MTILVLLAVAILLAAVFFVPRIFIHWRLSQVAYIVHYERDMPASWGLRDDTMYAIHGVLFGGPIVWVSIKDRIRDQAQFVRTIRTLDRLPSLEILSFMSENLDDTHVQLLCTSPFTRSLDSLCLRATAITDASIPLLAGLEQLTTMDITLTQVSEAGLEQLKTDLPTCEITWGE